MSTAAHRFPSAALATLCCSSCTLVSGPWNSRSERVAVSCSVNPSSAVSAGDIRTMLKGGFATTTTRATCPTYTL